MVDIKKYGTDYLFQMLSLLQAPKYASLRFSEDLLIAIQSLMMDKMLPILEKGFDGISPGTIDSTMRKIQKEVVPEVESIDFTQYSGVVRAYYQKVKANRRGIALLFEFYNRFVALPNPFDDSLHNEAFVIFGKNIEACWSTVGRDTEKLKRIFESAHRINDEYMKRQIALLQLSRQVDALKRMEPLEQLRAGTELVGKVVATCIEPMIAHAAEIIAIAIDKTPPKEFKSRIVFMQAHCPKAEIDLAFLELDELAFIRNAVAHAGVFFDYEDERISLKNVSGSREEVKKYSFQEMERLALLSISIVQAFGEYLKYVAFRYKANRNERKQWVRNMLDSIRKGNE